MTPPTRQLKKFIHTFLNFAALVIGVGAGIAQLAGFSSALGQLVLTVVGISCLLYLVVRLTLLYYVKRGNQLRQQVADANRQMTIMQVGHQRYVDAIDRIIDQEGAIYSETLELTVTIGGRDEEDTVVERRRTVPKPRVTQRAIRPIVPVGERTVGVDDIHLESALVGIAGNITVLPLTRNHRPRVWLVFDPGLTEPFDWFIKYRPPGLWAPLRRDGFDYLAWNDRLPAGSGGSSALTGLVVRFVFPDSERPPSVFERHSFGNLAAPERLDSGDGWLVTWRDPHPAGHRYEWDLAQDVRVPDRLASRQAVR